MSIGSESSTTAPTDNSKNSKSCKQKAMDSSVPHVNPPAPSQQRQLYNLTEDHRSFNMIRVMHLADCITLLNGFCGINSIFASLCYALEASPETPASSSVAQLYWAGAFIPLGLFFDFMDGKVARWRHKSSLMGQELDSLADLISFGAAPAILAYAFGFRTIMDRLVLSFFFLCGLARLARFNVTAAYLPKDASGKSKYFEGTPIPTTMSLVFVMLYWLSRSQNLQHIPGGVWYQGTSFALHPTVFMFAVSGCAMVSKRLKVPKI